MNHLSIIKKMGLARMIISLFDLFLCIMKNLGLDSMNYFFTNMCEIFQIDERLAFLRILVHENLDLLHENILNLLCEDEKLEHGRSGDATVKRKNRDEKDGKQSIK